MTSNHHKYVMPKILNIPSEFDVPEHSNVTKPEKVLQTRKPSGDSGNEVVLDVEWSQ